eukprot:783812-Prymnesium_polylepis.1
MRRTKISTSKRCVIPYRGGCVNTLRETDGTWDNGGVNTQTRGRMRTGGSCCRSGGCNYAISCVGRFMAWKHEFSGRLGGASSTTHTLARACDEGLL